MRGLENKAAVPEVKEAALPVCKVEQCNAEGAGVFFYDVNQWEASADMESWDWRGYFPKRGKGL